MPQSYTRSKTRSPMHTRSESKKIKQQTNLNRERKARFDAKLRREREETQTVLREGYERGANTYYRLMAERDEAAAAARQQAAAAEANKPAAAAEANKPAAASKTATKNGCAVMGGKRRKTQKLRKTKKQ
jgi:hypothetical protein